jgi:DNA-binding MarR family transcriptional regulator
VAEPRWLDDEEQRAWQAFVAAQRVVNTQIEQQLQRDFGIPHTYYEILARLSQAPGRRLRMSELAVATNGSRSRLSHAVGRLEREGWVVRQGVETDRRGQAAVLTEKGFELLRKAAPGHVETVRQAVFDALTREQIAQLAEISRALADRAARTTTEDLEP